MEDKDEVEEIPSCANEWEVVSLTASAYAAAPCLKGLQHEKEGPTKDNNVEEEVLETSHAMFLSSHFVFPPSQHENLPLDYEAEGSNIHDVVLNVDADEKEFDKDWGLQGLDCVESEQYVHGAEEIPPSPKLVGDGRCDGSYLPREAWWKKSSAYLYAHAKEVNSFWSICISAAVMGLVIIGHRWQHGRLQISEINWQFSVGVTKAGKIARPLSGFKDVMAGGHQHESSGASGSNY